MKYLKAFLHVLFINTLLIADIYFKHWSTEILQFIGLLMLSSAVFKAYYNQEQNVKNNAGITLDK